MVPSRFDAAVTATSRVRAVSSGDEVGDRQLGGRHVELPPAHGDAGQLGRLHPGSDVGVVVEALSTISSPAAQVLARCREKS